MITLSGFHCIIKHILINWHMGIKNGGTDRQTETQTDRWRERQMKTFLVLSIWISRMVVWKKCPLIVDVSLSFCLIVFLALYLSVFLYLCLSVCLSVSLSFLVWKKCPLIADVSLSFCLSVCLPLCLSKYGKNVH